ENEAGIACVGVALTREGGRSLAVSVTGPIERMGPQRRGEVGQLLREALARLAPRGDALAPRGRGPPGAGGHGPSGPARAPAQPKPRLRAPPAPARPPGARAPSRARLPPRCRSPGRSARRRARLSAAATGGPHRRGPAPAAPAPPPR